MKYSDIAAINVNDHVEKKQNLSYLSWAWAVDCLLRLDENASWEFTKPEPCGNDTFMVFCAVTAFGRTRKAQLPVMDHRNKAIANPDAFQINVAMQRCLAKAIALHGLGLYIYAGEDLPTDGDNIVMQTMTVEDAKQVMIVENAKYVDTSEITVPDTITGEAEAVDFIVAMCNEFIPAISSRDALREFWKNNKSALSRVQTFSKPMYEMLEATFKTRAGELK
jgi:hypothetical protein